MALRLFFYYSSARQAWRRRALILIDSLMLLLLKSQRCVPPMTTVAGNWRGGVYAVGAAAKLYYGDPVAAWRRRREAGDGVATA